MRKGYEGYKEISKIQDEMNKLAFLFYIAIVIFIIPVFLYLTGNFVLLEAFLPNVDLIATVLTFASGDSGIFSHLYTLNPADNFEYWSELMINYIAILGMTYMVAREVHVTKNMLKGWSLAFFMALATYLVPTRWLYRRLQKAYNYFPSKTASVLYGVILCTIVIGFEGILIDFLQEPLAVLLKMIRNSFTNTF